MPYENKFPYSTNPNRRVRFITISFSVLAFGLIALSVISFLSFRSVREDYRKQISVAFQKLALIDHLYETEDIVHASVLDHLSSTAPEQKEALQALIRNASEENSSRLATLESKLTDPKRKQLFDKLNQEHATYYRQVWELLQLSRQNMPLEAQQFSRTHFLPASARYKNTMAAFKEHVRNTTNKSGDRALAFVSDAGVSYFALLLLAVLAVIATGLLMYYTIRQLKQENLALDKEIKERMQLEKALCESQKQYKSLFNNNPMPMWVYDQNTLRFLEVNEAAVQEYGMEQEEFLQKTILDIRPDNLQKELTEHLRQLDKTAAAASYRLHRRKDGSLFHVLVKSMSLPDTNDTKPRIVTAINIHNQVAALEKLERQEKQLREVSSSIPGAVYQFQLNPERAFSFLFVSDGIVDLFGATSAEIQADSQSLYTSIHPEDRSVVKESVYESYENLAPWEVEFRVWQPALRKYSWVRGQSLPTKKEDGTVLWNGTFIDITYQKEAQEELIKSEANLRALLDSSPQAIFLLDKELRIIAYNAVAAADAYRFEIRKLEAGQSILHFISDAIAENFVQNHALCLQGDTIHYETGQNAYWHEVTFRPVTGPGGKTLAVALSINDISEQKRAIETIRQNEVKLARAQQLANIGNWELDIQRRAVNWSDEMYSIYELPKETYQPTASSGLNFIHPEEREEAKGKYLHIIARGGIYTSDHKIILNSGQEKYISQVCEVITDEKGIPSKLIGAVQDITERVLAKQEITEAKNLLQSTLENIPEIIFSTDAALKVTYVSPQCDAITGYPAAKFLSCNQSWLEIIHPEDRKHLNLHVVARIKSGLKQQCELRITDAGGHPKWLLIRISPLLDERGAVVRVDGSAADMTQYKQAEVKRQELTEELLRQNQNLQQFAYIVSHNLRAPIANIMGLTSIYDREKPMAPSNLKVVDSLETSAKLLDTTIRDLNDLLTIRSELNKIQEEVCLAEILDQVLLSLSEERNNAGAYIEYDFSAAPKIKTVRSYAYSILLNLTSNAIKYRSEKRKLHLKIKTSKVPNYICLSVSDNGIGLDLPRIEDKIFGLYKRFHANIKGKGLGLHLVKTQAELLGGKVEVRSQVDIGTTFNIYFKS